MCWACARRTATRETFSIRSRSQAARREDVLNSLSQIARKFRTRVGESLATVEKHSTPLAEATTSSLEALKAYSTGMKVNLSSGNAAAIPFFRRAVEIDPKFAMAYANLGLAYSAIGESVLSAESTTKAWQLRDRVSDREKFFIDFIYDRQVTGNLEKAYQTLELWIQTYPRRGATKSPGVCWGAFPPMGPADLKERSKQPEKESRPIPTLYSGMAILRPSYFLIDRFAEAESTLQRASERKLEIPHLLVIRYNIAVLKGDKDADGPGSGSGQGQAQGGTLDGPRGGSRSGSFRPLAGGPAVIEPRRGSGPARGGTRGGSELPGRTSGVGSRLRECCRSEKERHGGARAFQGPGRRIRRRPCPGSFGRLLSIGGARRRSGKALPGRYVCQIYLRTGSSRVMPHWSGASPQTAWSGCKSLCPMSWR